MTNNFNVTATSLKQFKELQEFLQYAKDNPEEVETFMRDMVRFAVKAQQTFKRELEAQEFGNIFKPKDE